MPGMVIQYNRRTGHSDVTSFDSPDGHRRAFDERVRLEQLRHDPEVEIVSLAGSSLEMIRQTHRRYFVRDQEQAHA